MNTLTDHVGRVITARDDSKAPGTPFRPFFTEASTTKRLTFDVFSFSYGDGYKGEWWLGWTHPWVKLGPKKKVLGRVNWAPYMAWNLRRHNEGSRYTECHHEWHEQLDRKSGLIAKLNETLDPAYALANPKFKYMVTAGLAATFEDYLDEFMARPEVVTKIAEMAVLA